MRNPPCRPPTGGGGERRRCRMACRRRSRPPWDTATNIRDEGARSSCSAPAGQCHMAPWSPHAKGAKRPHNCHKTCAPTMSAGRRPAYPRGCHRANDAANNGHALSVNDRRSPHGDRTQTPTAHTAGINARSPPLRPRPPQEANGRRCVLLPCLGRRRNPSRKVGHDDTIRRRH